MHPQLPAALLGATLGPDDALAVVPSLIGPVTRFVYVDDHPARRLAIQALTRASEALIAEDGLPGRVGRVLDWYAAARSGEGLDAYAIDRHLPGSLGAAMRAMLDLGGQAAPLNTLEAPWEFQGTVRRLREMCSLAQTLKKEPGPALYDEARREAWELVHAAERGDAAPPTGLRLYGSSKDLDDWASEVRSGASLNRGLKVWNGLRKHLGEFAQLANALASTWTDEPPPPVPFPEDWRAQLEAWVGAELGGRLAELLEPIRPEPPHMSFYYKAAKRDLAALQFSASLPMNEQLAIAALAEEACSVPNVGPAPKWARDPLARWTRTTRELEALVGQLPDLGLARQRAEGALALALSLDLNGAEAGLRAAREFALAERELRENQRRLSPVRQQAEVLDRLGQAPEAWAALDDAALWAAREAIERRWQQVTDHLVERGKALHRRARVLFFEAQHRAKAEAGEALQAIAKRAQESAATDPLRARDLLAELESRVIGAELHSADLGGPELSASRARLMAEVSPQHEQQVLGLLEAALQRRKLGLGEGSLERGLRELEADPRLRDTNRWVTVVHVHGDPGKEDISGLFVLPLGLQIPNAWALPHLNQLRRVGRFGVHKHARADILDLLAQVAELRALGAPGLGFSLSFEAQSAGGESWTGPWRASPAGPTPAHRNGLVAWIDRTILERVTVRLLLKQERADVVSVIACPPTLEELAHLGCAVREGLSGDNLAAWLDARLGGVIVPEAVDALLADSGEHAIPATILEARAAAFGELFRFSSVFQNHRDHVLAAWLGSEHSAEARELAVQGWARDQRSALDDELRALREARATAIEAELQSLSERAAAQQAAIEAAEAKFQARQAEIDAYGELLDDARSRAILEVAAQLAQRGASVPPPHAARAPVATDPVDAPVPLTPYVATPATSFERLVRQVGKGFRDGDVVATLGAMLTSRWTLLAGPPGVGKSTLARSLLARLGHGPGTERYLELVVRRDWHDDAALFGFWHPSEGRWSPSSEGLVEHLLRARLDQAGGLFPVVLEELNLASPEHYLSRPLSALEAPDATLRLYEPGLAARNAARYPPSFAVAEGVRLIGTVNVDDTVERLSPRFLSRCAVVFIQADGEAPGWRASDDIGHSPLDLRPLLAEAAVDRATPPGVAQVIALLQRERVPGAPTARARAALGRFVGLVAPVVGQKSAEDLAILQRVLPPLRGVGPRFGRALERLGETLAAQGYPGSAARCAELIELGRESGEYYDFFHG